MKSLVAQMREAEAGLPSPSIRGWCAWSAYAVK